MDYTIGCRQLSEGVLLCKSWFVVTSIQELKAQMLGIILVSTVAVSSSLQVPIQVNKYLAYSDGMRVIESGKLSTHTPASDGLLFTELDR